MKIKLLFIVFLLLSVSGCKQQQKQDLEEGIVITPLASENIISDLSTYIDSIILIPLETNDHSLVDRVSKMLLLPDGRMLLRSSARVLLFNPEGKFLFQAGQPGRGPEEYKYIEDLCLNQDAREIWILADNEIVIYSSENGQFIRKVVLEMPDDGTIFYAIASGKNGSAFLYDCVGMHKENFTEDNYSLFHYDTNGRMQQKYLPCKDMGIEIGLITQSWNNQYILRPQDNSNVCYYLSDSLPEPKVKIDFGDKTVPNHYSRDLQTYLRSDFYKMPIYIHDTQDLFYFVFCGPEARENYCIHSFVNHRTITWKRQGEDEVIFQILGSDQEFFYGIYADYRSPQELPRAQLDLLKRAIVDKTGIQIPDDNNPFIVKIRFKI